MYTLKTHGINAYQKLQAIVAGFYSRYHAGHTISGGMA